MKAESLVSSIRDAIDSHVIIKPFTDGEEGVKNADIVVTATAASTPILKKEWLKPTAHVNGIEIV